MRRQVPQLYNGARLEEWFQMAPASWKVDHNDTKPANGRFDSG